MMLRTVAMVVLCSVLASVSAAWLSWPGVAVAVAGLFVGAATVWATEADTRRSE